MQAKMSFVLLWVVAVTSCTFTQISGEGPPEPRRHRRLQGFIHRLVAQDFSPSPGEVMYPFTYVFQKAEGGEMLRNGKGFVLISDSLWCLVQRWHEPGREDLGQRLLIVDRDKREFLAEMRRWPKGNPRQKWNNWICIRYADPQDESGNLFHCEYYYPEGTERRIYDSVWSFYEGFSWDENGRLERISRFGDSFVQYHYQGLKLKRIEFGRSGKISTFADFAYE